MAQSSDELIKREIIQAVGYVRNGCRIRIFPEGSNDDQKLVTDGGLTFKSNSVSYGSCDAGWFYKEDDKWIPFIGLEGTDALNRGSSGNAQYQRFHHALGAVKEGYIGVYYLRKGLSIIQPDLYGMAYNASITEKGIYLIVDDLQVIKDLLDLRLKPNELKKYIDAYLLKMKQIYDVSFKQKYKGSWGTFAIKRSTIIKSNYIIKYAARMKRNFTDGSQRAGHIAVGEMYLTKYFFPNKTFYYLFPKMTQADIDYLDKNKGNDKEWYLLRNEPNVIIVPIDNLSGVSEEVKKSLIKIKDLPSKGDALATYNTCAKTIVEGLNNGKITIKM
ncbi:hypothetical protein [Pedobacter cryophilus]|uniref:Uncharacterized protein n=1 Tax=Pedobacter cryophilus TaxID=2571271 RepID=A0A4V5P0Z0_9SPHI|nr:hypothetical protein [Pedobacter cryophilus]TKC00171.1 hypothetical protein FA046_00370 [Pedobacter cryophilus]